MVPGNRKTRKVWLKSEREVGAVTERGMGIMGGVSKEKSVGAVQ